MVDLDPFGGFQSVANSINDAGEIIGTSCCSPTVLTWLYSNGKFTNLSQTNEGVFINNNGQIVGVIPSTGHAALYSNGAWTDLGEYQGHTTEATGINTNGQIVGFASFKQIRYTDQDVGLIFRRKGPVNLNTLIPPNSGFTITEAEAINDAGQIAGNANLSSDGQQHAVLLTPKK
jgi:probable HAF family extracellular repeat protein